MKEFYILADIKEIKSEKLIKEVLKLRESLLKLIYEKVDLSSLKENETLLINHDSNGKGTFDFNSINDIRLRNRIREIIEESMPIIF